MRKIGLELNTGKLHTSLLGVHLPMMDNNSFCESIVKQPPENDPFGYSSNLIYALPVNPEGQDPNNINVSNTNIIVNLLTQLKAISENNNIFRNSNMIKQQIVKQLQLEGSKINSGKVRSQLQSISNMAKGNTINKESLDKTITEIVNNIKKKV